jgi:hypothetical protein
MNDITYWNNFYNSKSLIIECSDFCKFVIDFFATYENIKHIVDCGCGNGRDSYALSKFYIVHGVDNSGYVPENKVDVIFSADNFITFDKSMYDLIYSRFTFHSISNESQTSFLSSIPSGKYLAIETRSIKGENEYVYHGKTHYRNYTDVIYLKNLLNHHNFEILYMKEGDNMAKYKDENPICIRVVCKKL